MENFSENKRKRGRPEKVMDIGITYSEWISEMRKRGILNDDNKSERSYVNYHYMWTAQGALAENEENCYDGGEFSFIICMKSKFNVSVYKKSILQELGRLEDHDVIRFAARYICENKLNTSAAVTHIKQFRFDKKQGSALELTELITKTINTYMLKRENVDRDLMLDAIGNVFDEIRENFS
jgi:hypothetical protein